MKSKYTQNILLKVALFIFLVSGPVFSFANTYTVTKTSDHYPAQTGELRWAIEQANNHPGLDYINFNIASTVPAVITLAADYPISNATIRNLPKITDPVILDGATQPANGYNGNEPKVVISGGFYPNQQPPNVVLGYILDLNLTENCIVRNITIKDYNYCGILIDAEGDNHLIENCVINSGVGAAIRGGNDMKNSVIRANYFGTDRSFSNDPDLSVMAGIILNGSLITSEGTTNNLIGGDSGSDKNYFYNSVGTSTQEFPAIRVHYGAKFNAVKNNVFVGNIKNIDLGITWNNTCDGNECKSSPVITSAQIIGGNITVEGTSEGKDHIEIYKSNTNGIDAIRLVSVAEANNLGNWSFTVPKGDLNGSDFLIGTATDPDNNTSEFSTAPFPITDPCQNPCLDQSDFTFIPNNISLNEEVQFSSTSSCSGNIDYSWNFGDPGSGGNNTSNQQNPTHVFASEGSFTVHLITDKGGCLDTSTAVLVVSESLPCENCIGSFAPIPGEKYVVSGWAKEYSSLGYVDVNSYTKPRIEMEFALSSGGIETIGPFIPKGYIINEWQLIEEEFEVPLNAIAMKLHLKSQSGTVYFDDIRLYPFDGNMNSFVYDPNTLRLMAELDERNYGTFYEYDEEGRLVRIKKETERGIMTIKENRSFTKKNW